MNHKVFAPDHERSSQSSFEQQDEVADRSSSPIVGHNSVEHNSAERSSVGHNSVGQDCGGLNRILQDYPALVAQLAPLTSEEKVALIQYWMAQLDSEPLQSLIAFGQQQLIAVSDPPPAIQSQTRLLLKKDYTYQRQGLSQPTQYYVYLRRRKPKLDRYIGTLFYVPRGCVLSYRVDAEGRILFDAPHNLFQLKDPGKPSAVRVVRLLYLEPPPPDYTFTKQQHDSPQIFLHLEELDPLTHRVLAKECYPFPFCMYEGGQLDRYRWEVSAVATAASGVEAYSGTLPLERPPLRSVESSRAGRSASFFLSNREQAPQILERMRSWVSWSDRAMPQSCWEIVSSDASESLNPAHPKPTRLNLSDPIYTLQHRDSKRTILTYQPDRAAVSLSSSLPVVMKWFQDLGLAVSESQNQRQYTAAELKLAHSLFINMSLSQTDPLVVLKQLFSVSFTSTAP